MAVLTWDDIGSRTYESGLDKAVLYLPSGEGIPWNGLTSVVEHTSSELSPVYYEGTRIHTVVSVGEFTATMRAITYPDEFLLFEGFGEMSTGFLAGEQPPQLFSLCYRSKIDSDLGHLGHKIHIVYNVLAIPNDKTFATLTNDASLSEFEWELYAMPEEIPGFRPTSHFVIDTTEIDPELMAIIEPQLYGSDTEDAQLPVLLELAQVVNDWYRIRIIDNNDGTWDAEATRFDLISVDADGIVTIDEANADLIDSYTYDISDTRSTSDIT